jgi:conjugative transfer signal peptidase TraF
MTPDAPTQMLGWLAAAVTLVAASTLPLPRRIVYNPTPSAPVGWYAISQAGALHVHDFVLAQMPDNATLLAGERRYLARGVPILKEVGACEGQTVCVANGAVSIDGMTVARTLSRDGAGRSLASWSDCRPLVAGELFLLSRSNAASFDSRYFGPITQDAVIGKATPLWTW